jgi:dolichyl-phosphate beta-glucosyltransferase
MIINRHWHRHYPGRIIATIISMISGLPFYDTGCGAKLIERTLAEQLFAKPFISPWLFDVKLITRIVQTFGKQEAGNIILELPLDSWPDIGDLKISLNYPPKVPYELIRI